MSKRHRPLETHQQQLRQCRRCPAMSGPPVVGRPVLSPVMLVGQAPGAKEIEAHRPFAWTAGKTLFQWFGRIGLDEEAFRSRIYMAAVCRCYPGKTTSGGDRVPARKEIENCAGWLDAELELIQPRLILPAGQLAISQFLPPDNLRNLVGTVQHTHRGADIADVIPLPHPSGASPWHRTEPGKTLLTRALDLIADHPAWQQIMPGS